MMLERFIALLLCTISVAFAVQGTGKRTKTPSTGGGKGFGTSDVPLLNYALTLEYLEYTFYAHGLAMLGSNTSDPIYPRLVEIRNHEQDHINLLTATIKSLGGKPVQNCTYNFGYNDSAQFLAIAQVLETVGTSAYIGAAPLLINPALLTAAATIATVEARHASYLNIVNQLDPFPASFDSPLDPQSVITLASGFITSCPSGQSLLEEPRAPLKVTSGMVVAPGSTFNFTTTTLASGTGSGMKASNGTGLWCVFYANSASTNSSLYQGATVSSGGGNSSSSSNSTSYYCQVPQNAHGGDNYVFASRSQTYLPTLKGALAVVAGPTIVWIQTPNTTSATNSTQ